MATLKQEKKQGQTNPFFHLTDSVLTSQKVKKKRKTQVKK